MSEIHINETKVRVCSALVHDIYVRYIALYILMTGWVVGQFFIIQTNIHV